MTAYNKNHEDNVKKLKKTTKHLFQYTSQNIVEFDADKTELIHFSNKYQPAETIK